MDANNTMNPNRVSASRLNRELLKRVADLESENARLKEFNDAIMHALSTPFDLIDSYFESVRSLTKPISDINARAHMEKVHHFSAQGRSLLKDLVAFSRVSNAELHWQEVDLSAMIHSMLTTYREAEPERNAELFIQPGLVAHGDPLMVRLMMMNVLGNAWKYSAKAEITRIEVFGHESTHEVEFVVHDNGVGFDPKHAHQLFDLFQRYCDDPDFDGTGVGLATAACVIARHGGRIWAEGGPGLGASFYVALPKQRPRGL